MYNIPILFLIFNRPENTLRAFEEIKKQKPKYLYVAADGARPHVVEDLEKCKATRELVIEGVDWDCEVKTLLREENLGCGKAVQSALDWFFSEVEMGIIIEDADGKEIGVITSGTQSPSMGKAIGMGYVAKEHAAEGTEVYLNIRDKAVKAQVVKMPFM